MKKKTITQLFAFAITASMLMQPLTTYAAINDKTMTNSVPIAESSMIEETPIEEIPVTRETPSVTEETSPAEETPPVADITPMIEETPAKENTAAVKETPVIEETPIATMAAVEHTGAVLPIGATFETGDDNLFAFTCRVLTSGEDPTVTVTKASGRVFDGKCVISSTVTHDGVTYRVTEIAPYATMNFDMKTLILEEGITKVGENALKLLNTLESLSLPSTLEGLDEGQSLEALKEINLADGNQYLTLENGVLYNKDKSVLQLYPANKEGTEFTTPAETTRIGDGAFGYAHKLKTVNLQNIETISDYAFARADGLETINIPATVTDLGTEFVFNRCTSLKNIFVDDTNSFLYDIDGVLYGKVGSKNALCAYPAGRIADSYTVAYGTTDIVSWAMTGVQATKEFIIPSTVTNIGTFAFLECNAMDIILKKKVAGYLGVNFIYVPAKGTNVYVLTDAIKNGFQQPIISHGEHGGDFEVPIIVDPERALELILTWYEKDGNRYYYDANGQKSVGLCDVDGQHYYFAENGAMQTGLQTIAGTTYYFGTDGTMQTGWQEINKNNYYFDADGKMHTGLLALDGKKYYFSAEGILQTGIFTTTDHKTYYADANGVLSMGFVTVEKKTYYFDDNGRYQNTGWQVIEGKTYYFQADFSIVPKGFFTLEDKTYYLTEDGSRFEKTGIQVVEGKKYFFADTFYRWQGERIVGADIYLYDKKTGVVVEGFVGNKFYNEEGKQIKAAFVTSRGNLFYINTDGTLFTDKGFTSILGQTYFLEADSSIHRGWLDEQKKKYYMNKDTGILTTGTVTIEGKSYTFDANGVLKSGWVTTENQVFYYKDGSKVTGLQWLDGATYYFNEEGSMQRNTTITIGSKKYVLASDGRCTREYTPITPSWQRNSQGWWWVYEDGSFPQNKWEQIGSCWYYFDGSGYMLEQGWHILDGTWYYMNQSGARFQDGWLVLGDAWYYCQGDGKMAANQWIGTCYMSNSGAMLGSGWHIIDGYWYYMSNSGYRFQDSWLLLDGTWYYCHGDGKMAANQWIHDCYVTNSGAMLRNGWYLIDGSWYLLNNSGYRLRGWQWRGGSCYFLYDNGKMAADTWIGNYYVNRSGAWVPGK